MNDIFSVSYSILPEHFKEGIALYYKKYSQLKDIIIIAVLVIISADFAYAMYKSPDNKIAAFLLIICISLIFVRIFSGISIRKRTVAAASELSEMFTMSLYDDKMTVKSDENEQETEINFSEKRLKIFQTGNIFLIVSDFYYIIPVSALAENKEIFIKTLQDRLQSSFICCIK